MSFSNTPVDIAEKILIWSIVFHDECDGIDDLFCAVCTRRMSLMSQGFLHMLRPYMWRHMSIRAGTKLITPSYLSVLNDAQSAIDFLSTKKHIISFVRQLHVIAPFPLTAPSSHSYSSRDAVTDLMMLLPNLHTAAFFNVILDELPCLHRQLSSVLGMNIFMRHFSYLDALHIYWPEPILSPLYFYNTKFLRDPGLPFIDCIHPSRLQSRPVIDTLVVQSTTGANPLEWFCNPDAGPAVWEIRSTTTAAMPFDFSYSTQLFTLSLDIDIIHLAQTHASLLSLPMHSSIDNLTIIFRGPYFIPQIPAIIQSMPTILRSRCRWLRAFMIIYETTWSIVNETEFTRLAWILTSVFDAALSHVTTDFQMRQSADSEEEGPKMALKDLSKPFCRLLKTVPVLVEQQRCLCDGTVLSVLDLNMESEKKLVRATLNKYSLDEVKRTYAFSDMDMDHMD
ncbi:uncharacterized protein EV420DRAFT_1488930 [Desarmillaria tabescens]|uniref:Uncharacterized protein n=1 Tax=Armillaria tabescens TaxID=1929756 RepID=A0AA39MHN8_ARMTA|nr:uncharacterized protein EV420DRAFT_1488930 [Desarmillaria tabescens]KAK0433835.1 hypothetical protein EV420DRAFT_1488930 [Desarmillaria tabescens]